MTMCTVKEIQEAIREDCKSQHDMDTTDIDRVMQTLPFAQVCFIFIKLCAAAVAEL